MLPLRDQVLEKYPIGRPGIGPGIDRVLTPAQAPQKNLHHLSATRSLWQTQSKILSKHHLSAARSLWQTQSKILSKHYLSTPMSPLCFSFEKTHFSIPVCAKKRTARKSYLLEPFPPHPQIQCCRGRAAGPVDVAKKTHRNSSARCPHGIAPQH